MRIFIYLFLLSIFFSCNQDIENVKIYGKVTDDKNIPINKAVIKIENAFYGNSPDQSYSVYENYKLETDSLGFYSIELEKSALIQLLISKDYHKPIFKSKHINSKNVKLDFTLQKLK